MIGEGSGMRLRSLIMKEGVGWLGKSFVLRSEEKKYPQALPLFQTKYEVTRICTEVLSKKIELLFGISSKIDYLCTKKVSIWKNLYPILHPNRLSHTVQILMPT